MDRLKDDKERLLNSLIEAERQVMLWEKKTQLAKETREAVDADVGEGEMAVSSTVSSPASILPSLVKKSEKVTRYRLVDKSCSKMRQRSYIFPLDLSVKKH